MHATVSGSIAQMSVGTQMRVAPQAVNPLSAKMSLTAANVSPVQVILTVPELARTSKLDYASVKINGQPIALAGKWESDPRIGPRCVHLFFDRSKIVAILGPSASQQVVTLQIAFGGGHLLVASDIIKLW